MNGNKSSGLKELSVQDLFAKSKSIYEVPIYQRSFAWGKDEIDTLIQDVYGAYKDGEEKYYIGTLVTFHKETGEYEVIDGQQRLTAIRLILSALGKKGFDTLTYKSRKTSSDAFQKIDGIVNKETKIEDDLKELRELRNQCDSLTDSDEKFDSGIIYGFRYAIDSLINVVGSELGNFKSFFLEKVYIIRYQVPKDTDLNQYFEIMNSRGEQLEQHEIVKANLMKTLEEPERKDFAKKWEACSKMDCYIQQSLPRQNGKSVDSVVSEKFDSPTDEKEQNEEQTKKQENKITIDGLCSEVLDQNEINNEDKEDKVHFQQIIDFPNFLLIVLKITAMCESWYDVTKKITLDDKKLQSHFLDYFPNKDKKDEKEKKATRDRVKKFTDNLRKAKFYLDNYIVHRPKDQREEEGNNPWQLQIWKEGEGTDKEKKYPPHNLCENRETQDKLVQILSMFEVTYGSRQRKNYLFYCLLFLMDPDSEFNKADVGKRAEKYLKFLEELAERYLYEFYLKDNSDSSGNFDEVMLELNNPKPGLQRKKVEKNNNYNPEKFFPKDTKSEEASESEEASDKLQKIFGDGKNASSGIPLFIFNYLDYKIWKLYYTDFQGKGQNEEINKEFIAKFGCNLEENKKTLNLSVFKNFFFSRSRDSLEHYFPVANLETDPRDLNESKINCLGNYAMIGGPANSSGSNRTPEEKVGHYLSSSNKIDRVSVSSLKFRIMMKMCKDNGKWTWHEISNHQTKMLNILFDKVETNGSQKGNSEDDSSKN